ESPLLEEYLRLDESVFHFYFLRWQEESDPILSDLCIRFMNRKLFKYVNIHPDKEKVIYEQLRALFKEASIDPDYYLALDASSDLPYEVYHAGEGRVPIYMQITSLDENEVYSNSCILLDISCHKRTNQQIYKPTN